MKLRALKLDVPLRVLVGAGMGHKFNEESTEAFTAFLTKNSAEGRPQPPGRTQIRFITYTPKYNKCEWLTIDEMGELYEPATVEGGLDDEQTLRLNTGNVTALSIARGISDELTLDKHGPFPLSRSAESTFVREGNSWRPLSEAEAQRFHENPDLHKRHDLQGPIDDAFMQPFLSCVAQELLGQSLSTIGQPGRSSALRTSSTSGFVDVCPWSATLICQTNISRIKTSFSSATRDRTLFSDAS
ncbi:MAG: hypothetical protein R3B91_08835 [Planctomycetaceae bacterium]